jgi:alkylated DNA repair dioxygenase AlkB
MYFLVVVCGLILFCSGTCADRVCADETCADGSPEELDAGEDGAGTGGYSGGWLTDQHASWANAFVAQQRIYWEPCGCDDHDTSAEHVRGVLGCRNELNLEADSRIEIPSLVNGIEGFSSVALNKTFALFSLQDEVIPGLRTVMNLVTPGEQKRIAAELEQFDFALYGGKHCAEFGYNFSLYNGTCPTDFIPPLANEIGNRLVDRGLLQDPSDHVLANRYQPGEGIHPHVDDDYFYDGIASVSLLSGAVVRFSVHPTGRYFADPANEARLRELSLPDAPTCIAAYFPAGSAFVLHGEARYGWVHEIADRPVDSVPYLPAVSKSDLSVNVDGDVAIRTLHPRHLRYAVTYRRVRGDVAADQWAGTFAEDHYPLL